MGAFSSGLAYTSRIRYDEIIANIACQDTVRIHVSKPTDDVELILDDRRFTGRAGESVAAALFAAGIKTLRRSPRLHQVRGMFCLMGSCQECLVMVDGRRVLACQTLVAAGLRVRTIPETGTGE